MVFLPIFLSLCRFSIKPFESQVKARQARSFALSESVSIWSTRNETVRMLAGHPPFGLMEARQIGTSRLHVVFSLSLSLSLR